MGVPRISQKVAADNPARIADANEEARRATDVDPFDLEWIKAQQGIEAEKARAKADRIELPKAKGKEFIVQEIKVDAHNTIRRVVELTLSMCRERNCGFDAAKEFGYTAGWETVPHEQVLPSGKTLGEVILDLLSNHTNGAHGISDSHILSEAEYEQMGGWAPMPGQDQFLSGVKN